MQNLVAMETLQQFYVSEDKMKHAATYQAFISDLFASTSF